MACMRRLVVLCLIACASCGTEDHGWVRQSAPQQRFLTPYYIWVSGEDDVWLGGTSMWHFEGFGWREVQLPRTTIIGGFYGFAANDVWALGNKNPPFQPGPTAVTTVLHWDGSSWHEVPTGGITPTYFLGIWGTSDDDLWISDEESIDHFDGTHWSQTNLGTLLGSVIWGASSSDIWIPMGGGPFHFDGTQWTRLRGYYAPTDTTALWGTSADNIWTTGFPGSHLLHQDGTGWSSVPDDPGGWSTIWGTGADDVYAGGYHGSWAHFDGTAWTFHPSNRWKGGGDRFLQIHGSSPTNLWASVIEGGAALYRYVP